MSSMDINSERVCYVQCNFCNTILAVNVPCSTMYTLVTVRCGHCANLLSVNVGALLQSVHLQDFQNLTNHLKHHQQQSSSSSTTTSTNTNYEGNSGAGSAAIKDNISGPSSSSSSRCNMIRYTTTTTPFQVEHEQPKMPPIRPPEKRQRVPSAYNRFIKEEIQRIKTRNPEISHREAFSTAAKNWAHFPHIHFGLNVEGNKQAKLDHPVAGVEGTTTTMTQKSLGFY